MNNGLLRIAKFTRDILSIPESSIKLGRHNLTRDNFQALQIVLDLIGPANPIGFSEKYDNVSEIMTYYTRFSAPALIHFYGDGAYTEAMEFAMSSQSELGLGLQKLYEVGVYRLSSLTDVKFLTGSQFSEHYELSLNIQYTETRTEGILAINSVQLEVDNG